MHTTNAAATKLLTTRTGRSSAGTRNPNGAYGGSDARLWLPDTCW